MLEIIKCAVTLHRTGCVTSSSTDTRIRKIEVKDLVEGMWSSTTRYLVERRLDNYWQRAHLSESAEEAFNVFLMMDNHPKCDEKLPPIEEAILEGDPIMMDAVRDVLRC